MMVYCKCGHLRSVHVLFTGEAACDGVFYDNDGEEWNCDCTWFVEDEL